MRQINSLRIVAEFALLASLIGWVGNGVVMDESTILTKGVIVGD